ncbi:MAG: Ppx/GppA phosphatase family protein [Pseudomonadota bacterium]
MAIAEPRLPRKRAKKTGNGKAPPLYAAVDLGTNNCRLLIAKPSRNGFRIIDSYSQITRLGEGLTASGRLSDVAIERSMDALGKIRAKLKSKRVGHVRCIATEACRKAENGAAFIARVREELGLTFKIIGPGEEARLAMVGCHDLIDPDADKVMVLDIGGGSTEISLVDGAKLRSGGGVRGAIDTRAIELWGSLPLGVVTLSEAFSHLDEANGFEAMRAHARQVFEGWSDAPKVTEALSQPGTHIVGTSGTVTCLAGVHLKLDKYRRADVDGAWLSRQEAGQAIETLRVLGLEGRSKLPTIGPERAGLMLSGCAIVDAAWALFPAERLRVADRGLREGLLLTMIHGQKNPSRRRRGGKRRKSGQGNGSGAPDDG